MRKIYILAFLTVLSLLARGQTAANDTKKPLCFGLNLAVGAQRVMAGNSDFFKDHHSVTYTYNLDWGWRVQSGVVGDYRLARSQFGIRFGLAVGLRREAYSYSETITDLHDPASGPIVLRLESDHLLGYGELRLGFRYSSVGLHPWMLLLGGYLDRYGTVVGSTRKYITGGYDPLSDGQVSGLAIGPTVQVSKRFTLKCGALEPVLDARCWVPPVLGDPRLWQFTGMVGVNFWPGN